MNILVIATHWRNSPARMVARGFSQLGHTVRSHGYYMDGYWKPNNDAICPGWADLIVETDQYSYFENTKTPHVLYAEDPLCYNGEYYAYRDYIHLDHEFYADSRDCEGRKNAHFLPCAYDLEYCKSALPYKDRVIPIAMYGQLDGGRQEVIDAIKTSGIHVATGYVDFGLFIDSMQNVKISLCHGRANGNVDQRIFESMAMGCAVLSDRKPDLEALGAEPGWHYAWYDNAFMASGLVKLMLECPDDVIAQIERARDWVKPHTWKARCQTILDTVRL